MHLRDPDVPAKMRPAAGDGSHYRTLYEPHEGNVLDKRPQVREWTGHAGATRCGRFMLLDELWVEHAPEDVDPTCDVCFGRSAGHEEPTLC